MSKAKNIFYILTSAFAGALLLCCFVFKGDYTNLVLAGLVVAFAVAMGILVKKRSELSIKYRQVAAITLAAAVMMVTIYFLSSLGFGFYKTPIVLIYLTKYILPFAVAIIAAEYMRMVILAQNTRFGTVFSYLCFVLLDIVMFSDTGVLSSFTNFVDFCGMIVFPAITANVLYNFLSKRYGFIPNVLYRLVISIYPYLTPIKPAMPKAMLAFLRVLLPLLLLIFIRLLYEKRQMKSTKKSKAVKIASASLAVLFMTAFIMLITCQFRFGLLVVATESMTGELNKGDALVYEQYSDQTISKGQVIVFNYNKKKTIHRVVDIQKINGEFRFYTKGDANDALDLGYRTESDIIGIETLKIKYLGYPTVWVRELFNK